jgi:hypothetical protein
MKNKKTPVLLAILTPILLAAPASARFEAGTFRFGAGLGLQGHEDGIVFSLGAAGGVFVLKGLDVGISTVLHTGDIPTQFLATGGVRFIPLPDLTLTPYIRAGGGRLFVEGDDAWTVSAGGGLLYMFGPWYGIDLQGTYMWFFFPGEDPIGDWYITAGLVLLF